MKVKVEREKVGLKLNIQKTKIMASGPISSVQFSHSDVSNSLRPHELQHAKPPCPSPVPGVYPNSSFESVMPSNYLILCLLLLLLSSIFPSIRVFSNELAFLIRWSEDWSFSFGISPSNEYSGSEFTSLPSSSVQFSHSDVSNSLRPHELQQARPPCPSPTPRVHST